MLARLNRQQQDRSWWLHERNVRWRPLIALRTCDEESVYVSNVAGKLGKARRFLLSDIKFSVLVEMLVTA